MDLLPQGEAETDFEVDDFTSDLATRRKDLSERTLPEASEPEPDLFDDLSRDGGSAYGIHRVEPDAEEDAYLKGEENFDDFEVDLTLDDDKNTRF